MRNPRPWLLVSAAVFAAYLLYLVFFVVQQANAQTRHLKWSKPAGRWSMNRISVADDGRLFVRDMSGKLTVFEPDGSEVMEFDGAGMVSGLSESAYTELDDGSILLLGDNNPVFTMHGGQQQQQQELIHLAADGEELGRIQVPFTYDSSGGLHMLGDAIVLQDQSSQLRAIDMDGNELWVSSGSGGIQQVPGPDGGLLILDQSSLSGQAELTLIDGMGQSLWHRPLLDDAGSPVRSDGERIFYTGSGGMLHCLDSDGNELWNYSQHRLETMEISQLQYMGPWMDSSGDLQLLEDGGVAAMSANGDILLIAADGSSAQVINVQREGMLRFKVDEQAQRVVVNDSAGYRVYDYEGRLQLSNGYVRGQSGPELDRERRLAYISGEGSIYCMQY